MIRLWWSKCLTWWLRRQVIRTMQAYAARMVWTAPTLTIASPLRPARAGKKSVRRAAGRSKPSGKRG